MTLLLLLAGAGVQVAPGVTTIPEHLPRGTVITVGPLARGTTLSGDVYVATGTDFDAPIDFDADIDFDGLTGTLRTVRLNPGTVMPVIHLPRGTTRL